ncbi:hypothetical protein OGAPHI_001070 [Ogataea philodendri]|uniref:Uncharacterized protein n=1 Tax=Ogataea philodendri TaxID=1378263 RepID=A0A9P8PFE5_9ASCO|nr:uncharacterized protein OGAPHI_001070 [Ogataea philodendri]KAH3670555.1 hypothetical protein OGAPHI_001070 [Ogataea philodendri]
MVLSIRTYNLSSLLLRTDLRFFMSSWFRLNLRPFLLSLRIDSDEMFLTRWYVGSLRISVERICGFSRSKNERSSILILLEEDLLGIRDFLSWLRSSAISNGESESEADFINGVELTVDGWLTIADSALPTSADDSLESFVSAAG